MAGLRIAAIGVALLGLVLLGGCAASRTGSGDGQTETTEGLAGTEQTGASDQLAMNLYARSDDWQPVWNPHLPAKADFSLGLHRESTEGEAAELQERQAQGFRVQLDNVTSKAEASRIQKRALQLFDHVYIIFHSPSYKVRGGDYLERGEALQAAENARASGYRSAWVVPDNVVIYPEESGTHENDH